jgi:hypothetical protein
LWRPDGKELFYAGNDGVLYAATIRQSDGEFETDEPRALPIHAFPAADFQVSPDGQRFLVVEPVEQTDRDPLILILNWAAGLKK